MKKISITLSLFLISCAVFSQSLSISEKVKHDFEKRFNEVPPGAAETLQRVKTLGGDTLVAMEFLYAYMPLPDITDKSFDFYLKNTEMALKARNEMPWGKDIPDKEFLHFVLPARAQNEALDTARTLFFEALQDRVRDMTIEDAILEANHWSREKVSYQASDGRTSNPLSTMSQAIGRCGEQSVFAVTALRSIGIPARQIYTPRWAHTDDNHAWVEAWANGKWHFIGGAEPAPVLDLAWFNEPASRGMMMNTNVYGLYPGPEEIIDSTNITSIINVTSNYAPVGLNRVRVVNSAGEPVKDAKVNFCIYNYAEFYPIASKSSDDEGLASLLTGFGDLLVWVTDGKKLGYAFVNPINSEVVDIVMETPVNTDWVMEKLIVPPVKSASLPVVTDEQNSLNDRRMAYDDSIRNAYIATFITVDEAKEVARSLAIDDEVLSRLLTLSRGNHKKLVSMLQSMEPEARKTMVELLQSVKEKDLRDIDADVIKDNVFYTITYPDSAINTDYVLNPRVDRELLTPYKKIIQDRFGEEKLREFRQNPSAIIEWIKDSISIYNGWNPAVIRMYPASTLRNMATDSIGRNIFTVALARAAGVPAQVDPVTMELKYMDTDGKWQVVKYGDKEQKKINTGKIHLNYTPVGRIEEPRYYSQFSLAMLQNGVPVQLQFDEDFTLNEVNASSIDLEEGQYLLISGQRMADGSVLSRTQSFYLYPDSVNEVELIILQDTTQLQVLGNVNAEDLYFDLAADSEKSLLSTAGRGFYVLGIIGGNDEPSSHVLNDIAAMKEELEKSGREIIILYASNDELNKSVGKTFPSMPSNVHMGVDTQGNIMNEIKESLNLETPSLPIFVVADSFNRIIFVTQGYTIGLGNTLLDVLSKVNN